MKVMVLMASMLLAGCGCVGPRQYQEDIHQAWESGFKSGQSMGKAEAICEKALRQCDVEVPGLSREIR